MQKYSIQWALEESKKVKGWLHKEEAELLYNLGADIPQDTDIIEIGSAYGKSTIMLASSIKKNKISLLFSIDPHQKPDFEIPKEYDEWAKGTYTDSYVEFTENMNRLDLEDSIISIKKTSEQAYNDITNNVKRGFLHKNSKIGLLFIDGLHARSWVEKDFLMWSPLVVSGGFIVFHDANQSSHDFEEGAACIAKKYVIDNCSYVHGFCKSIVYGEKK